jgi:hypothetical protein
MEGEKVSGHSMAGTQRGTARRGWHRQHRQHHQTSQPSRNKLLATEQGAVLLHSQSRPLSRQRSWRPPPTTSSSAEPN